MEYCIALFKVHCFTVITFIHFVVHLKKKMFEILKYIIQYNRKWLYIVNILNKML